MQKKLRLLFMLIALSFTTGLRAQTDSLEISLLTCEPGKAIYELYGHTAILVEDITAGTVVVYNYGMFDFNTPNFMLKFTRGHTDYVLGTNRFTSFTKEYSMRGSKVFKQPLNLSQTELRTLDSLLRDNIKPENRTYRYNFLYNNCATMALDKIEESISGTVTYPEPDTTQTIRNILTQHTSVRPWSEFGVDIILGAEIDRPLKYRQEAFAPLYLMDFVSKATVTDTSGMVRPLVLPAVTIVEPDHSVDMGKPLFTPIQVACILAAVILLLTLLGWYKEKRFWLIDALLYGAQGLAGIIITFMYFFSEHPAVGTNWLVLIFNPVALLLIPFMIRSVRHRKAGLLVIYEFIICTAFLVCSPLIPQYIEPAVYIIIAAFAARALLTILFWIHSRSCTQATPSHTVNRITVWLLLISAIPIAVQAANEKRPKLVVGIVVDQLDRQNVEMMLPMLCNDGIKRMWYDGYNRDFTSFDYDDTDRASAIASIYTGASPFQHGIVAERWMNRSTLMPSSLLDDGNSNGINTIEHTSPERLLATNLADEMKLESGGRSRVCAIAVERDASILAAGHEADVAIWLNHENGKWCSSDFYGNLPAWVESLNESQSRKYEWQPLLPASDYIRISVKDDREPFSYTVKPDNSLDMFTSPLANDMVTNAALIAVDAMKMGSDDTPDLLALTYYAGNFRHENNSISSFEQQDIFLRLDRNISELIQAINDRIGQENVLYFLTSTGYTDAKAPDLKNTRIPSGTMSMERATALLNLYLSAKYGSDKYVETYYCNQIYLNHNLIEDKGLSLHEVLENCVDLLVQVSGIKSVFLMRDLMSSVPDMETARKRNAYHRYSSGDIVIEAIPGWGISDENEGTTYYRRPVPKPFPMVLYGNGIRAEINHEPVSISTLAPTICNIIRCDAPNTSYAQPLSGIK
jgi:hypothetical protein